MFGFGKERARPLVLHVDDDREIREIVAVTLIRMGLDVILAQDGPAALEMAQREKPDLVLLDIRMPGMDGFDACHHLKADAKTKDIPVVMLTAMGQVKDVEKAIAYGADGYLQKPLDPVKLKAKIGQFVKFPQPPGN